MLYYYDNRLRVNPISFHFPEFLYLLSSFLKLPLTDFPSCQRAEGLKPQEEFASEFREEYKDKDHCPCKKACRYHGNCKECVAIHRAHQEHVPNCMRPMLNRKIKILSELTEHTLANEIEPPKEHLRKEFL